MDWSNERSGSLALQCCMGLRGTPISPDNYDPFGGPNIIAAGIPRELLIPDRRRGLTARRVTLSAGPLCISPPPKAKIEPRVGLFTVSLPAPKRLRVISTFISLATNLGGVLVETVDEADRSSGDRLPVMIAKQSSARNAAKDPDHKRTNDIGLHRIPLKKETGQ